MAKPNKIRISVSDKAKLLPSDSRAKNVKPFFPFTGDCLVAFAVALAAGETEKKQLTGKMLCPHYKLLVNALTVFLPQNYLFSNTKCRNNEPDKILPNSVFAGFSMFVQRPHQWFRNHRFTSFFVIAGLLLRLDIICFELCQKQFRFFNRYHAFGKKRQYVTAFNAVVTCCGNDGKQAKRHFFLCNSSPHSKGSHRIDWRHDFSCSNNSSFNFIMIRITSFRKYSSNKSGVLLVIFLKLYCRLCLLFKTGVFWLSMAPELCRTVVAALKTLSGTIGVNGCIFNGKTPGQTAYGVRHFATCPPTKRLGQKKHRQKGL